MRSTDGIRFVDVREAAARPDTWLGLFQAAIDEGCAVSDEALACVQQHVGRFTPEEFFPNAASRDALLRFLKPRPGLYARLSEMHDSGLLGQMFPEFKAISCRVVRDFYHKYTVDEHTLLTIRNLERLAEAAPERERFARLLGEIDQPELLVLALLYHDVGKWRDDDHHVESARMARQMFERLRLDRESRETIDFLVVHHLDMSVAAFRRDTEDPEIVRQFSELIGVEERLKMLCLMTLADVEAVSRETLTPWKEELLWRLYVDTYNYLTLSYSDEVIERNQAAITGVIEGREADLTAKEIEEFLQGLPRRYLQLFSREAVYRHVRLSRGLGRDVLHAWIEKKDAAWELTVITNDKPFLFSNISGVLSSYGMDILRGYAFTKPDGLVVDMFHFTDEERFLELNPEDGEALIIRRLEEVHRRARRHRQPPQGPRGGRAAAEAARIRPRRALRQRLLPPLHHRRDRGREPPRSAVSSEPCDVGVGLRRRSRAHCHRGAAGDRRLSSHARRQEAHAGAAAGSRSESAPRSGGTLMKLIKAIVRPNKVDEVKDALERLQISGMTVTEVRGHGKQKGHTAIYRGQEYNVSLLPKMEIEVVIPDSVVDDAVKAITQAARTGEIGDGRIFVIPVEESYKIRTGEREM